MGYESLICLIGPVVSIMKKIVNLKCNGVYGVCIPKGFGKSECVKALESEKFLLLDFENLIKLNLKPEELTRLDQLKARMEMDSYNAHYYPLARDYLEKMKKDYKGKNILVFCSDPKLLNFCGIKKILFCAPNTKFFNSQINNISSDVRELATRTRDDIVRSSGEKLKGYGNWDELIRLVSQKYNLKAKI